MDFNSVFTLVFLGICVPFIIVGYYLYKKILTKIGIFITFIPGGSTFYGIYIRNFPISNIHTNIGKNIKNDTSRYIVNFIGDIFINLFFALYCIAVFGISFFVLIDYFNK